MGLSILFSKSVLFGNDLGITFQRTPKVEVSGTRCFVVGREVPDDSKESNVFSFQGPTGPVLLALEFEGTAYPATQPHIPQH